MNSVNQSVMPMTAKINQNNNLEIGGCDCIELAKKYKTPLYVIDEETIRQSCRQYKNAFSSYENTKILFASKSFLSSAICRIMFEEGIGLDVVSGGEIYTAMSSHFPGKDIYFNGNNKSYEELKMAVESGIGRFTVDNFYELELLNFIAKEKNQKVSILIRVTPGIECHTHDYIKTGQIDSKFGFDLTQIRESVTLILEKYINLELKGLHAHIGSQIFETDVYYDVVKILLEQMKNIKDRFNIVLSEMNIGGGLGIRYTKEDDPPSMDKIASVIIDSINTHCKSLDFPKPTLILEPGRSITGTSGVTLYRVGGYKQVPGGTKYVMIDGGMADNPRPAMYGALYEAVVANKPNSAAKEKVTIAGRYCESGDILIKDVQLPIMLPGDILCVFDTGAYNYSMSSNYNSVPKPAAVLVNKGESEIFIKRQTYKDLVSLDVIPDRLMNK